MKKQEEEVEFRPLPGTDGMYYAGSDGRIYSTRRIKTKPEIWPMAGSLGSAGYLCTGITLNGKRFYRDTHSWICLAFHGPKPSEKHQVRHLDGNKLNNRPSNLTWGTGKENMRDMVEHNDIIYNRYTPKLSVKIVIEARLLWGNGHSIASLARRFNVHKNTMSDALYGKSWRQAIK